MKQVESLTLGQVIVDFTGNQKWDSKNYTMEKISDQGDHFLTSLKSKMQSEGLKTLLSFCYAFFAIIIVAASTVIVQNRVYHMKNFPALPDVVLDHVQYQNWALATCETVAVVLMMIWTLVIFFHRERLTLIKRTCYILANLLLLRALTIIVTAVPLIDVHKTVQFKEYVTYEQKLIRTLQVAFSFALSLNNSKDDLTYGDYIFSGHLLSISLLFNFINHYMHKSLWPVQLISWCLFLSAVPLMLAAHGHYTIDVILATYIATQYFHHYHSHLELHSNNERSNTFMHLILFPFFKFIEGNHIKNSYDHDKHNNIGSKSSLLQA